MKKLTKPKNSVVRQRTLAASAAGAWLLSLLSPIVVAQQVTPSPAANPGNREVELVKLEAFAVTGSNIRRAESENSLPVTSISLDQIEIRGVSTPVEMLQSIPAIGSLQINESDLKSGVGARGDVANLNLRSLSSGNTLVLLNGRRMVPHPISQADGATGSGLGAPSLSVNVNTIPGGALSGVEVLRDGASAIYGSDASAGVINNLTKRALTGDTLRVRLGANFDGNSKEATVSLSGGRNFNRGKSNVSYTVEFFKREALSYAETDFASTLDLSELAPAPWNGKPVTGTDGITVTNTTADRSGAGQWGFSNYRVGAFNNGVRPAGNVGISTTLSGTDVMTLSTSGLFYIIPTATGLGIKTTAPSKLVPFERNYYGGDTSQQSVLPSSDRLSTFITSEHSVANAITAYGELGFYRAFSRGFNNPKGIASTIDDPLIVSANNPFNPFGSRFYSPTGAPNPDGTRRLVGTPQPVHLLAGSMQTDNIIYEVTTSMGRILGGLKGTFGATWQWDAAALWSASLVRDQGVQGQVRKSRLRELLDRSDSTAFNPFGATFTIGSGNLIRIDPTQYFNSRDLVSYISSSKPSRYGRTELGLLDAKASGELFNLPGGPVGLAAGMELRYETYRNHRDEYYGQNPSSDKNPYLTPNDNDYVAENPDLEIEEWRTVFSQFAEVAVPVVGPRNGIPGLRAVDLSAAVRHEQYSLGGGSVTRPKFGTTIMPVRWLKFRGSVSHSYLAPNLAQVFDGSLVRFANFPRDPYRATVTNLPVDVSSQRIELRVGNKALKPENARTLSYGAVISPPALKGLTVTVDVWSLKQSDAIGTLGSVSLLQRDEANLLAATQAQLAAGKSLAQIDLGSGTGGYQGISQVTRLPVRDEDRAAFASYNSRVPANQQRAPVGIVQFIRNDLLNLKQRNLGGIDLEVEYITPKTRIGTFRFNATEAYTTKYEAQADETRPFIDYRWDNQERIPVPLWRASASVNWTSPDRIWGLGVFATLTGSYQFSNLATTTAVREALGNPDWISGNNFMIIPAQRYYTLSGTYRLSAESGILGRWLGKTEFRWGINNLLNALPPWSSEPFAKAGSGYSLRGRTFYIEGTKRF